MQNAPVEQIVDLVSLWISRRAAPLEVVLVPLEPLSPAFQFGFLYPHAITNAKRPDVFGKNCTR